MFFHFTDRADLGLFFFGLGVDDPEAFDQADILQFFTSNNFGNNGLSIRIMGLPSIPGAGGGGFNFNNITPFAGSTNPADLNNIQTAAGGDSSSPQSLNNLQPAGGGEETSCWGDAANAAGNGQTANLSVGGSMDDQLNAAASCGSSI